jgi:hypothetical protein
MSCKDANYILPRHSYSKYRVVSTPDFDTFHPKDPYSPRNRPNSLSYWLNGRSNDTDLPEDDDIIIQVDPDMVLLPQKFDFSNITAGNGVAARYELRKSWIKQWALPFCNGKCDTVDEEDDYDPGFGMPMVLTAGDARRHADLWSALTEEMRTASPGWQTEMFSNVIAARRLGIWIDVYSTMLSAITVDDPIEPWDQIMWNAALHSPVKGVWVAHYCQAYKIQNFTWYKYHYSSLDIRQCDRSQVFPSPSSSDLEAMEYARDGPLTSNKTGNKKTPENVYRSRTVWLLDNASEFVRRAIGAYYEEFC